MRYVPIDPRFVPPAEARVAARSWLAARLPGADEVEAKIYEDIRFVDPGANFEGVFCPFCGADVMDWWMETLDATPAAIAACEARTLPCCEREAMLNDLRYVWPAGFATFVLEARNPGLRGAPDLPTADRAALEVIVGCRLRTIWAHY